MEPAKLLGLFPAESRSQLQEAVRSLILGMGWQSHAQERDMMLSVLERHPLGLRTLSRDPTPRFWFVAGLGFAPMNVNFMVAHILELIMDGREKIYGLRFISSSRYQPSSNVVWVLFEISTAHDVYFYGGKGNIHDDRERAGYQMISDLFALMSNIFDVLLSYCRHKDIAVEWHRAEKIVKEAVDKGFALRRGDIAVPNGWPQAQLYKEVT